jgi:hypothetical protein
MLDEAPARPVSVRGFYSSETKISNHRLGALNKHGQTQYVRRDK